MRAHTHTHVCTCTHLFIVHTQYTPLQRRTPTHTLKSMRTRHTHTGSCIRARGVGHPCAQTNTHTQTYVDSIRAQTQVHTHTHTRTHTHAHTHTPLFWSNRAKRSCAASTFPNPQGPTLRDQKYVHVLPRSDQCGLWGKQAASTWGAFSNSATFATTHFM